MFGSPPVAMKTTSGCSARTSACLGIGGEAERHVSLAKLRHAPIDDADEVAPPGQAAREADLPAGLVLSLEHRHRMAALGGDAGGFQPRRPGPHHHHAAARPRSPAR